MATKKKLLQAAAGQAGGEALNVEDVFSTYLYEGTNATQTITNGIDLDGEGGLVWVKDRDQVADHQLLDSEQGFRYILESNNSDAHFDFGANVITPQSDGFDLSVSSRVNQSGQDFASWTFRKAPKFFDVVTYNGDGVTGRTVSHNLGSEVGCLIVKRTDTTGEWMVWHKDVAAIDSAYALQLQSTNAAAGYSTSFNSTAPTSTEFTLGNNSKTNNASGTYVAYLFAHNDGDGDFGADGDADIIKCGSFEVTTGSTTVDVGFEPQFILHKRVNATGSWVMWDTMRGYSAPDGDANGAGGDAKYLYADLTNSEPTTNHGGLTSNGFVFPSNFAPGTDPGDTYIYIAIRRGTKVPESATEVFDAFTTTNAQPAGVYGSMGPVDLNVNKKSDILYGWRVFDRLRGDYQLNFDSTNVDNARDWIDFDEMDGININSTGSSYLLSDAQVHYNWKRAPNFFDVVAYKGTGSGTQVLNHNLGVAPELVIQKGRSIGTNWTVAAKITDTTFLKGHLNSSGSLQQITYASDQRYFTNFSDTSITIGNDLNSNDTHIMYLFASLDGISKVGTFATSSDLVVDCGFTTGARFVLVKRVPSALGSWDNWFVFDTERGITTSADGFLELNTTDAESTDGNNIESHSSGFKIKNGGGLNFANGNEFIFYAIA